MAVTITDYGLNCDTHSLYRVDFHEDYITTLVTDTPSKVRSWISKIKYRHRYRLRKLVVGLDVELPPVYTKNTSYPAATLQLCVGHNCLIVQLCHCSRIPKCLFDFLGDPRFTFVGVGIAQDVQKISNDYGLRVPKFLDLRDLEARQRGWAYPRNIGLKNMALEILGQDFDKPRNITMSRWDNPCLSPAQVQYACVDAFVSFEIGRVLRAAYKSAN